MGFKHVRDTYDTNYVIGKRDHPEFDIADSRWTGDIVTRYRSRGGPWRDARSSLSGDARVVEKTGTNEVKVSYKRDSTEANGFRGLGLIESYRLDGPTLWWTITFSNHTNEAIELGDLALPLLFNSYYVEDPFTTYQQRVVRHALMAGDQCFILLSRPNGVGPYLLMTPLDGTRFEYFDRTTTDNRSNADHTVFKDRSGFEGLFMAYIHSVVQGREIQNEGTWRLGHTSKLIAPKAEASYAFRFQWAADYDAARNLLVQDGLADVHVIPGMSIPADLTAMFSVRTNRQIDGVMSEFPAQTVVTPLRSTHYNRIYGVKFSRFGENRITVHYADGREMFLEFFVTEPVETMIKKRAAFIVEHQQVRNTDKWYEGLFSLWDMKTQTLRNPDDRDGLPAYMVGGSDDPTLCKAPYVAEKNAHFPDQHEIAAVEYYIRHFVWGGLQRTDKEEPFSYGVYGSDNWFVNRNSLLGYGSGGNGREHMWRTFDYTHLIQLYFNMYRIAKLYPQMTQYLNADGYLDRAFHTAKAFYAVPYGIRMGDKWHFRGWCDWAYKQGNFHEVYIPMLFESLSREGRQADAEWLRGEWEKKVKYMVYDHAYPFGSEMFFDSTAFESTHAVAKYGVEHELKPDRNLWRDKNSGEWYSHPVVRKQDFTNFMEGEIHANIADRGWLETDYYQLGSDIRQHGASNYLLSYMTQMGGWSILDYAIYYASDSAQYMRLGYASYLGSWALINSGTVETHYGYWFPGKGNDGAAGWAYGPEQYFKPWAGHEQARGLWAYDGEIDSGFSGGIRSATTVVVNDPIFGLFAYGGDVSKTANGWAIVPKDGLRQRLDMLNISPRLHLELSRDGFSAAQPVRVAHSASRIDFALENRIGDRHATVLRLLGLLPGRYGLRVDGRRQERFQAAPAVASEISFTCDGSLCQVSIQADRN